MNHDPGLSTAAVSTFAVLFVGLSITGCSGTSVPTVPVHGTVAMNGKPLPGGIVSFVPVKVAAGLPNRPAQGGISADGTYSLSTFQPNDGGGSRRLRGCHPRYRSPAADR